MRRFFALLSVASLQLRATPDVAAAGFGQAQFLLGPLQLLVRGQFGLLVRGRQLAPAQSPRRSGRKVRSALAVQLGLRLRRQSPRPAARRGPRPQHLPVDQAASFADSLRFPQPVRLAGVRLACANILLNQKQALAGYFVCVFQKRLDL